VFENLLSHFFGIANHQCAMWTKKGVEMCACDRRPAAFLANFSECFGVAREKIINRLFSSISDVTQRMNADFKLLRSETRSPTGLPVETNKRTKAPCLTTDDGHHQRKPQHSGACKRFRCPTHAKPNRKRILKRSRIHTLTGERGAMFAGPVN